ncbi:MAG: hypothetical protein RJQ01_11740 [Microcella sp.]|uniref:hypothetical protein n=1 Tax=Microcella sp. TaxID=1913979 RepID=UPI003315364C
MTPTFVSTVGLILCLAPALLHAVEVVSPMLSRWIVRYVLPLFGPGVPSAESSLSHSEQLAMLDAARDAGPAGKAKATQDYIFLMLFEQRQGSLAFISVAVGAIFSLGLPLDERSAVHLMFAVMSVLFLLVNANHAGARFLGRHPRVSQHGKNVGRVFVPFWAVAAGLNVGAFFGVSAL